MQPTERHACIALYAAKIEVGRLDRLLSDHQRANQARDALKLAMSALAACDFQAARDRALDVLFFTIPNSPHFQRAIEGVPVYGEPASCYESLREQGAQGRP